MRRHAVDWEMLKASASVQFQFMTPESEQKKLYLVQNQISLKTSCPSWSERADNQLEQLKKILCPLKVPTIDSPEWPLGPGLITQPDIDPSWNMTPHLIHMYFTVRVLHMWHLKTILLSTYGRAWKTLWDVSTALLRPASQHEPLCGQKGPKQQDSGTFSRVLAPLPCSSPIAYSKLFNRTFPLHTTPWKTTLGITVS